MKLLTLLFRRSPGMVALAVLVGVAGGASNAGLLALINTTLHTPRPWRDARLVAAFAALCILLPLTRAASSYALARLGQRTVLSVRMELTRRILSAPLARLEEFGTPRLLVALTQDVNSVVAALSALPTLAIQGTIVLGCLGYLGFLSGKILAGALGFIALGVVSYNLSIARGTGVQRRAREEHERLYGHFQAVTGALKELKLNAGRREALLAEMEETGARLARHSVVSSTIFSVAAGWAQLLVFMVVGLLLLAAPAFLDVRPATLTGYVLVLLYIATPLDGILNAIPEVIRAGIAWDKLQGLGLWLRETEPEAAAPAPPEVPGPAAVQLAGAVHRYHREGEEGSFALGPVDLAVRPGEVVFLVGGNGSGKTTLAKMLLGLYPPEDGAVCVDGEPVDETGREAYRQRFSAVFSDFYLFDSLPGVDAPGVDARARAYLRDLRLDHKVRVEGGRLSTTALSQGQRKRLALLAAYLEDRPVYVFDEWAADQDPVFKRVFYERLLPELKARGKGVLVISHDDAYFSAADRVVKLEYGRVEYDGPPAGLARLLAEEMAVEPAAAGMV